MWILSRLFGGSPSVGAKQATAIPTVKFDVKKVTPAVKEDIRQSLALIPEFDGATAKALFTPAIAAVTAGGDLAVLAQAIARLRPEIPNGRVAEIARFVHHRAAALMKQTQQKQLGIEFAKWRYSGAPCVPQAAAEHSAYASQDAAHRAADGTTFRIDDGLVLDGKVTWPGRERGCKCVTISVIPGFS